MTQTLRGMSSTDVGCYRAYADAIGSSPPLPGVPPSVRLAVIVGHPSEADPYTIRVRVPHGVNLMPHRHPEDRVYTAMSGVFYLGLGDRSSPTAADAGLAVIKR